MPTILQPRDQRGRYRPGASMVNAAEVQAEKKRRAAQWRKFRRDFLFSQGQLAAALGCTPRTVSSVERAAVTPTLRIQRAFRDLVYEQKKRRA